MGRQWHQTIEEFMLQSTEVIKNFATDVVEVGLGGTD
jgi:hypothetical protein